jgi:exopolysaccharide biosynthesis operon protein EpsL
MTDQRTSGLLIAGSANELLILCSEGSNMRSHLEADNRCCLLPDGVALTGGAYSNKNRRIDHMFRRSAICYCVAGVSFFPVAAISQETDVLQFDAGLALQRDSNVFRLSDQVSNPATIGGSGRSDTILTSSAGLKFRKPVGLQRFEADLGLENKNYKNFSGLNFTAVNYAAAWRWSLTPAFTGNLTTDRREYVDNTADVQRAGQLNRRTDRSTRLDGEYEVDGVWRVLGGAFQRTTSNSQSSTFEGESKVIGAEAGVRYQLPFGNSLAYRFRNGKGEYTNQASAGSSDFNDREHEIQGEWVGGRARLGGRISRLERKYDTIPARDFSGFQSQIDLTYALTGKTSIFAGLVRELGSYQTNNISYYQGNRIFVAPSWQATDNIAVRARYDYGVRDFKGPLPGFAASNRSDKTSLANLAVEWRPVRLLTLMAWLQRDQRTSNEFGSDYKSNSVGISAKATF